MMETEQFDCLARRYIDTVFRVALNYLRSPSDADDVTQNVFMKLLRQTKDFESEEHVKAWLIRVTINECKNLTRAKWWRQESYDDRAGEMTFDSPARSELYYAVMDLPKKYRLPIYLHYYEGYSTQEIAALLHTSKNTVCTQLRRGRELLKVTLTEVEDHV